MKSNDFLTPQAYLQQRTRTRLREPIPVEDIYVDHLHAIEDAGHGNTRFVFTASQNSIIEPDTTDICVRLRLVTGSSMVWRSIDQTVQYFTRPNGGDLKFRS